MQRKRKSFEKRASKIDAKYNLNTIENLDYYYSNDNTCNASFILTYEDSKRETKHNYTNLSIDIFFALAERYINFSGVEKVEFFFKEELHKLTNKNDIINSK